MGNNNEKQKHFLTGYLTKVNIVEKEGNKYFNATIGVTQPDDTTKWTVVKGKGVLVDAIIDIKETMEKEGRKGHKVTVTGYEKDFSYVNNKNEKVEQTGIQVESIKEHLLVDERRMTITDFEHKKDKNYVKGMGVTSNHLNKDDSVKVPFVAFGNESLAVITEAHENKKQILFKGSVDISHYVNDNNVLCNNVSYVVSKPEIYIAKDKDQSKENSQEEGKEKPAAKEKGTGKATEQEANPKTSKAKGKPKDQESYQEPGF